MMERVLSLGVLVNFGDRYEGGWQDSLRNGRGVYTFANGDKWEGLYRNDKRVDAAGTFYTKA